MKQQHVKEHLILFIIDISFLIDESPAIVVPTFSGKFYNIDRFINCVTILTDLDKNMHFCKIKSLIVKSNGIIVTTILCQMFAIFADFNVNDSILQLVPHMCLYLCT